MAEIYDKVSDTDFSVATEITESKIATYSIASLKVSRNELLAQIARQTEELNVAIAMATAELAKIDVLLSKATELGVKEVATVINEPIIAEQK